jgi:hypothetical protein
MYCRIWILPLGIRFVCFQTDRSCHHIGSLSNLVRPLRPGPMHPRINLKNVLRQIEIDRGNVHDGWFLRLRDTYPGLGMQTP